MATFLDNSILRTISKLINGDEDEYEFDMDLIVHINTCLGVLNELGVGKEGFTINDDIATWADFLEDSPVSLNEVVSYIFYRVKVAFDSSTMGSNLVSVFEQKAQELEWRMMVKVESGNK